MKDDDDDHSSNIPPSNSSYKERLDADDSGVSESIKTLVDSSVGLSVKEVITDESTITAFVIPKETSPINEKLQWLKLHPVQPILPNMPFDVTRIYFRNITHSDAGSSLQSKQSETIPRKWLSYCSESKQIYCGICAVFSIEKKICVL